ncbi:unnamed protein product, partial [Chrysoparadoxa australica]
VPATDLLDNVILQSARTVDDQLHIIINELPPLIAKHGVKLVIVDSMSALFRSGLGSGRQAIHVRSDMLLRMAQAMKQMNENQNCVFVVVNQVSAQMGGGSRQNQPALGLLWSNCINSRYMLHR